MWHLVDPEFVITVQEPHDGLGAAPPHSHHALQLSFALQTPLSWALNDGPVRRARALLIAADVSHHVAGGAAFMCEPEGTLGRKLRGRLDGAPYLSLPMGPLKALGQALLETDDSDDDADALCAQARAAVDELTEGHPPAPAPEPRIARVMSRLREASASRPELAELAREAKLSPSRLRHLFVQEVGIPIRQYAVWVRSIEAMRAMANARSLAEVAHDSGFADQAALSRTHRRFFGRKPSEFARDRLIGS